ncbi:hypothetical protein BH20ACI4_BH20ACI4_12110 [soil metagenome]
MDDETDEICRLIGLNVLIGEAELKRDENFLREVMADEIVFRRANASVVTKDEYLADLIKPENIYEYLVAENIKAQVKDETALVSLNVRAKGRRGDKEFEGNFRNLRVFVRSEKNWQCVIWHNTRL